MVRTHLMIALEQTRSEPRHVGGVSRHQRTRNPTYLRDSRAGALGLASAATIVAYLNALIETGITRQISSGFRGRGSVPRGTGQSGLGSEVGMQYDLVTDSDIRGTQKISGL
jgi:hypothetical protein